MTMDDLTKKFVMKKFREFYLNEFDYCPPEFEKREWGIVPLKTLPDFIMHRHLSFKNKEDLKAHLLDNVPAHVYYSSAYYEHPSAEKMEDKGWICADLIFDIDADHIPLDIQLEKLLEIAKRDTIRLYHLLHDDFGIKRKDIKIVFSGSRGYHIHVYDRKFQKLGSAERREIVNYFFLTDAKLLLDYKIIGSTQGKRLAKCIAAYFYNVIKKGKLEDELKKYKLTKNQIETIKTLLTKENLLRILNCDLSFFPKSKRVKRMLENIVKVCEEKIKVHIDAPVTSDIRRLIRLPESLHGKTGLKVTLISPEKIENFNPFVDAVVFSEDKVKIKALCDIKKRVFDFGLNLKAGEVTSVPEYVAIFLMCRGEASYGY